MGYDGAEIHEDPSGFRPSLHPSRNMVFLMDLLLHGFRQRPQHPIRRAGTDHKIIRKRTPSLNIQQQDILRLFFFEHPDQTARERQIVQSAPPGKNMLSFQRIIPLGKRDGHPWADYRVASF
jgi:hypothetical protein